MVGNIFLLVFSLAAAAAMTLILRWFFRKLARIEDEHWAGMAGDSTPRWARFLVGRKGATQSETPSKAHEAERGGS